MISKHRSPLSTTSPAQLGPRRRIRRRLAWASLLVAVIVLCSVAVLVDLRQGEERREAADPPHVSLLSDRFMLGDYHGPIFHRADGRPTTSIDAEATITALTAAHVNTYAYLIAPNQTHDPAVSRGQFEQLPAFADLAARAGIDVYVYLVPPTEAPEQDYAPYHWDYSAWTSAIGATAVRHPAIRGIIMDDFGGNVFARRSLGFHFTPDNVADMVAAARREAPWLSFLPILYYHDLIGPGAMLSEYRALIDGVIFPYFGYSDGRTVPGNTVDTSRALVQGLDVAGLLKCYSGETCTDLNFPPRSASSPIKDSATLSAVVSPLPNQRRLVRFAARDDSGLAGGQAYTIKVLVDGVVAGTYRPQGTNWATGAVDVTQLTSGVTEATIELEIVRSHGITDHSVLLDDVKLTGVANPSALDTQYLKTSRGVITRETRSLPFIYMTYAKPLMAEKGRGASSSYVATVLSTIGVLRDRRQVDGSLIFNLHLPGSDSAADPESYAVVEQTYANWRR